MYQFALYTSLVAVIATNQLFIFLAQCAPNNHVKSSVDHDNILERLEALDKLSNEIFNNSRCSLNNENTSRKPNGEQNICITPGCVKAGK